MKQEVPIKFEFADLHCHPNLKTFGNSFSKKNNPRSNVWYYKPPTNFSKIINSLIGITRFSQADLTTMTKGNVKIAFVSLYPFEKGFFLNNYFKNKVTAWLANYVTSVGYRRIRFIQEHLDYFSDLNMEYEFLQNSKKVFNINGKRHSWDFVNSWAEIDTKKVNVIITIEGAHILNAGLKKFGYNTDEKEVIGNIKKIKDWKYPPLFITFAHNFNNELCGHARSLNQLGPLVDQFENINTGISPLGKMAISEFLNNKTQKRILIDLKHMSLKSRLDYYKILEEEFNGTIPLIVSHGAVTGTNFNDDHLTTVDKAFLCSDDINFYDEELILITKSKGLFALQMDGNRLTTKAKSRKSIFKINSKSNISYAATIVWNQLQHIAEVLDSQNLDAWTTTCLGTDFDGTINPLSGVWTAEDLQVLANELILNAKAYLKSKNNLQKEINKNIEPIDLVENFVFKNICNFLERNFNYE